MAKSVATADIVFVHGAMDSAKRIAILTSIESDMWSVTRDGAGIGQKTKKRSRSMTSGHLKETIMRVYDVRPSTAEFMMAALEMIDRATKNEYHRGWIKGADLKDNIKDLTSAEPKKGKWEKNEYDIPYCSECKCINNTVYRNFCPNCGADMRGEA